MSREPSRSSLAVPLLSLIAAYRLALHFLTILAVASAFSCGNGEPENGIDEKPTVVLITPEEGLRQIGGEIEVSGNAWDDIGLDTGEVHIIGERTSFFEDIDLVQAGNGGPNYSFYLSKALPRECHLPGEAIEIITFVTDTAGQTTFVSVDTEYRHECIPCEVIIDFNDDVLEETIDSLGEEIGAYRYERVDTGLSVNEYIIGFPIDADVGAVVDHFSASGVVESFDLRCFLDWE